VISIFLARETRRCIIISKGTVPFQPPFLTIQSNLKLIIIRKVILIVDDQSNTRIPPLQLLNLGYAHEQNHEEDDTASALVKRLQDYHGETVPILKHYEPHGVVKTVNANHKIDGVWGEVLASLSRK